MKKSALLVAGVMLAGSLFALAGCGEETNSNNANNQNGNENEITVDNAGIISGNYIEADAEAKANAISKLNQGALAGDVTAENLSMNFEIVAPLSVEADTKLTKDGKTSTESVKATANVKYGLSVSVGEEGPLVAGAGEARVSAKMTEDGMSSSLSLSNKIYNDNDYVYLETRNSFLPGATRMKVSVDDVIGYLYSSVGTAPAPAAEETTEDEASSETVLPEIPASVDKIPSISEIFEKLDGLGFKTYLDTTSGLKIKLSADETVAEEILKYAGSYVPEDVAPYLGKIEYSTFVFDVYFAIDENGKLEQCGVNANVSAALKDEEDGVDLTFTVKFGVTAKLTDEAVTLPNGIATDPSYTEVPLGGEQEDDIGGFFPDDLFPSDDSEETESV